MKTFYILLEKTSGRTVKPASWTKPVLQSKETTPYLWDNRKDIESAIAALSKPFGSNVHLKSEVEYYRKTMRRDQKRLVDVERSLAHAVDNKLDRKLVRDLTKQTKALRESIKHSERSIATMEAQITRELKRAASVKFEIVPVQINI